MSKFEFKVIVQNNRITASTANGLNKFGGEVKLDGLPLATIHILENWLNKGKMREREEFELLGKYLYEAIFRDLGDFFKDYFKKAQERQELLVVQLCFEETDKLANLPWEYLYSPDENSS